MIMAQMNVMCVKCGGTEFAEKETYMMVTGDIDTPAGTPIEIMRCVACDYRQPVF